MPFYAIQFSDDGRRLTPEETNEPPPEQDQKNRLLSWVTPNLIKIWAREILDRDPTDDELDKIVDDYMKRDDGSWSALSFTVQDLIDRGQIDDGEDNELEICNECGSDVSRHSRNFANRVPEGTDTPTRREMGKPFPKGAWLCASCDLAIRHQTQTMDF